MAILCKFFKDWWFIALIVVSVVILHLVVGKVVRDDFFPLSDSYLRGESPNLPDCEDLSEGDFWRIETKIDGYYQMIVCDKVLKREIETPPIRGMN